MATASLPHIWADGFVSSTVAGSQHRRNNFSERDTPPTERHNRIVEMTTPTSSGILGDGDGSEPGPRGEDRLRFYRNIDFNNNYYFLTKEHPGSTQQFESVSGCFLMPKAYRDQIHEPFSVSDQLNRGLDQGLTRNYLKATATIPY